MSRAMTHTWRCAPAIAAATAVLALAGCSSSPSPAAAGADLGGGSGNYSLTQTLRNDSDVDLTVVSATADNGGTVVPGYPTTVAKNTVGTFQATNSGNGVQLDLTLTTAAGQTLKLDSDNPRVSANWSSAAVWGTPGGISTGPIDISRGDSPTATFTLQSCKPGTNCTTASMTPAAPVIPQPG